MKLRRASLSTLVASSLLAAPVVASAAPVATDRSGSPVEGESLTGGLGAAWLVAAILVASLGILIFSDDEDEAVSP